MKCCHAAAAFQRRAGLAGCLCFFPTRRKCLEHLSALQSRKVQPALGMDTEKDLSSSRAESSASTGAEYTSRPTVNPNAVLTSAMRRLRGTRTRYLAYRLLLTHCVHCCPYHLTAPPLRDNQFFASLWHTCRRRRPDTHFEGHEDMWPKLRHTVKRPRKQHHHSMHVASQPSLKQQV